jgi:hypothetical protein
MDDYTFAIKHQKKEIQKIIRQKMEIAKLKKYQENIVKK